MSDETKEVAPATEETKAPVEGTPEEQGLRIGVGIDDETNSIIIGFGKDVSWISFRPDEAIRFGEMLKEKGQDQIIAMQENAKKELEPAPEETPKEEKADEPEAPTEEKAEEKEDEKPEAPAEEKVEVKEDEPAEEKEDKPEVEAEVSSDDKQE